VARFSSPNLWDVAGGVALVKAGGGVVREHDGMAWTPMHSFTPAAHSGETPDLRSWRRPIVVGTRSGVETMCGKA
jgi:myo-inositol-1(or 4)-monophosphatase